MDYVLPEDRIAQSPLEDRSSSKLLHISRSGEIVHRHFTEVVDLLDSGDLLVLNDTRVTAMRVFGEKPTGGQVELLLLQEIQPNLWLSLAKPGRRLQPGSQIVLPDGLTGTVIQNETDGMKLIQFDGESAEHSLKILGRVPLPPYIPQALADAERYQTVYAQATGSAAAPTAGLHFTPALLESLRAKGVETATVTLDVSIDTFRPIQVENLDDHVMHGETCRVPPATAAKIAKTQGRIIAVGTTTVRTLESFATGYRQVRSGEMNTRIFIRPGFEFQIIDGMFTNFHMPKTSMLLMLEALIGADLLRRAYDAALCNNYRFLSFGDSMLIL
ncbi:MAG: tRNA preQ1(34) S-adenosylmethionine ribosyltransferase-isomerase QueA [Fimbriimonadaceae bacterium]